LFRSLLKRFKTLKALLISKGYFENWLSAGFECFLYRRGLLRTNTLNVRCRDSALLTLPPRLYELLLSGLLSELFRGLSCRNQVVVAMGSLIPLQELLISEEVLGALRSGWKYSINYGYWFRGNVKFKHMRHYILEVFNYDEYKYIDVENRLVVDVGAGYGESAVYYVLRGARHVVAVEPCPQVFNELLENLKLNNVEDRVTPINAALTSTHSSIIVKCPSGEVTVNTVTLEDIAEKFDIRGAVLKMDCEGCEYDVVLNDYEHVRLFDEVYFEYHAFITKIPVEMLLERLSKDFECEIVSDGDFYRRHGCSRKLLGLVKCIKKH